MSSIATLFSRRTETVDTYRPPAMSGGKRGGTPVLHLSSVIVKRWPLSVTPGAAMLAALPQLAAARSSHLAIARLPVDVQIGDELHLAGRVDKVLGVGAWRSVLVMGLSEVTP